VKESLKKVGCGLSGGFAHPGTDRERRMRDVVRLIVRRSSQGTVGGVDVREGSPEALPAHDLRRAGNLCDSFRMVQERNGIRYHHLVGEFYRLYIGVLNAVGMLGGDHAGK
jgi:hypothetical protein